MNSLEELIRDEIGRKGPMRFDRFMWLALYDRKLGYYRGSRREPGRIGREGDFFTSVSVGPLFGRMLAWQIRQMVDLLAEEPLVWVIEQGAHDGRLARDILDELHHEPISRRRMRYMILEPSTGYQSIQMRTLGPRAGEVLWAKSMESWTAEKPSAIFITNELVDALPVRTIEARGGEWHERRVTINAKDELDWTLVPTDEELKQAISNLPLVPAEGCRAEVGLAAREWMSSAASFVRCGYILTIDYGFPAGELYAPHRRAGTLTTYHQHKRGDDVLRAPGELDITAHVDFTTLARVGEQAGWQPLALIDQERFLTGLLKGDEIFDAKDVRAWQTLTHPDYLGSRFKVLVQAKDAPAQLSGLRFARGTGLE